MAITTAVSATAKLLNAPNLCAVCPSCVAVVKMPVKNTFHVANSWRVIVLINWSMWVLPF